MMKIILQEDVPHLGVVGDLVSVRDGYGRNYLIPQGKAIHASPKSVRELDHQKRLAAKRRAKATANAATSKSLIESLSVVMNAKVAPPPLNDAGEPIAETLQKLFGTITSRDIAGVLNDAGVKVDHRRVTFASAIRTVGKFEAAVRLDGGIVAVLPFWVIPEGSADVEAEKKRVAEAQQIAREAERKLQAAAAAPVAPAPVEAAAAEESESEGDSDSDSDSAEA